MSGLLKSLRTMGRRIADHSQIPRKTAKELEGAFEYWKGKTTSELADSYMSQDTKDCISKRCIYCLVTISTVVLATFV